MTEASSSADSKKSISSDKQREHDLFIITTFAKWLDLEADIKKHGFNKVMTEGTGMAPSDPEWWIEHAEEVGTEFLNIHKYLTKQKHISYLRSNVKSTRAEGHGASKECKQILTMMHQLFRKDEKLEAFKVEDRVDEKLAFRFNRDYHIDDEQAEMKSITFQTIPTAPYYFMTFKFDKLLSEHHALEVAERFLSLPVADAFYEARKQYLTKERGSYKVMGDLLEGVKLDDDGGTDILMFMDGKYDEMEAAFKAGNSMAPEVGSGK